MGKVFLSYSRADSLDFVSELYRCFVRDGIECFFDKESIEWGDNFVLALEEGLNEADHIIIVLSPGFVSSEWTTVERTATMLDDPTNLRRKFLPLLHSQCEPPRFLKPIQYLDVTTDKLFEMHYPKIVQRLGGIVAQPAASDMEPSTEWPMSPLPFDWPIADHCKVRGSFSQLLTRATTQRLLTLSGPSGSGKSCIAQQMLGSALRIPDLACGLFNFKGTTGMENELRAFVQHLDVSFPPDKRSLNGKFNEILEALKSRSRPTLLIFDTYETVGEAYEWVEMQLLPSLVRASWLRVAITGQRVPKHNGTIWQLNAFSPIILEQPLPADWFQYGINYRTNLTLDEVETACELTKDHTNKASLLAQILGPGS